jgi:hypothetical protein
MLGPSLMAIYAFGVMTSLFTINRMQGNKQNAFLLRY